MNQKKKKLPRNFSQPFQGRVARAVSLCLYNKIQMAQLHWPETVGATRRSTFHLENYSTSPSINRMEQLPEEDITSKLLESNYDGLDALDECSLEKLMETDLLSSI